jgi:hypothetical protein
MVVIKAIRLDVEERMALHFDAFIILLRWNWGAFRIGKNPRLIGLKSVA